MLTPIVRVMFFGAFTVKGRAWFCNYWCRYQPGKNEFTVKYANSAQYRASDPIKGVNTNIKTTFESWHSQRRDFRRSYKYGFGHMLRISNLASECL